MNAVYRARTTHMCSQLAYKKPHSKRNIILQSLNNSDTTL